MYKFSQLIIIEDSEIVEQRGIFQALLLLFHV
jgi:hypothetical protein